MTRPAARKLINPADALLLTHYGDPRLSADGRLACTVTHPDPVTDEFQHAVEVRPVHATGRPRRIAQAHSPAWAADGRLAVVQPGAGGDVIVVLDPALHEMARISPGGEIRELAWCPDRLRIAFTWRPRREQAQAPAAAHAPTVVTHYPYRHDGEGKDDLWRRVAIGDLRSGGVVDFQDAPDSREPAWSPDGKLLAYVADAGQRPPRRHRGDVWVADLATNDRWCLTRGTGHAASPQFSPDGRNVAYIGHVHGDHSADRHDRLWVARADGSVRPRRIEPASDTEVGAQVPSGQQMCWDGFGGIVYLAAEEGRVVLRRADLLRRRSERLSGADEQVDGFDAREGTVVFTAQWPDTPSAAYMLKEGRRSKLIFGNDGWTRSRHIAPVRPRSWSLQSRTVAGFVVLPPEATGVKPPYALILDIHGGPHAYHPYPAAPVHVQAFAAAGFAVALPNPRGSGGSTEAWKRSITRQWGTVDYEDVMGIVDELIADGTADPQRLFAHGTSYGGYLTSLITTREQRFRAVAVGAMMCDLVSAAGTSDIPEYWAHQIGDIARSARALLAASPINRAARVQTPTLIFHWEGDMRCPASQSDEWFSVLCRRGIPTTLVRYPGGSHTSRTPSQQVDKLTRIIAWFNNYGL